MKTIEEAKNICRTIWHLYLEQRDYKTLATFVDQEMTLMKSVIPVRSVFRSCIRKKNNGMVPFSSLANGIKDMRVMRIPSIS